MDPRKNLLLALKAKAGLATPEELDVLENTPVVVGEGLAVFRTAASAEHWASRWEGITQDLFYPGPDDA